MRTRRRNISPNVLRINRFFFFYKSNVFLLVHTIDDHTNTIIALRFLTCEIISNRSGRESTNTEC